MNTYCIVLNFQIDDELLVNADRLIEHIALNLSTLTNIEGSMQTNAKDGIVSVILEENDVYNEDHADALGKAQAKRLIKDIEGVKLIEIDILK